MPRIRKFNNGKKQRKFNFVRSRDPTTNQLLGSDVHGVHDALQPPLTQVCYSCGQEDSEGLDLQSADYSNEMYCGSC